MEWPLKDTKTGKAKSTPTNVSIWKAALQPAAAEYPQRVQSLIDKLEGNQKNWRNDYISIIEEFCRIQMKTTPQTMVAMCRAGFQAATDAFVFRNKADDKDAGVSLTEAWDKAFAAQECGLETKTYKGSRPDSAAEKRMRLGSPHGSLADDDDEPLYVYGRDAVAQARQWADYGCMEQSAADHATAMLERADVTPVVGNYVFVLLGVTSEMGPATHLLRIPGAHVVGIARRGPRLQKLVDYVQAECPVSATLQVAEADLLQQGPLIARWLVDLLKTTTTTTANRKIVLMPMAYMNGEANVRVVLAMEQMITYVKKYISGCAVAYYSSPTICTTIPPACARDARERYNQDSPMQKNRWLPRVLQFTSLGFWFQPINTWKDLKQEDDSASVVLLNALVHLQGPNYGLSQTMKLWRCMMATADGEPVVPIVAPPTRTNSVFHNPEAAAALEGLPMVAEPNVCFDVASSSTLLTAILLHKLEQATTASANPTTTTTHPMELFWDGSVHGGGWRCAYRMDTCGVVAYIYGRTLAKVGSTPSGALAPAPSQEAKQNDENI